MILSNKTALVAEKVLRGSCDLLLLMYFANSIGPTEYGKYSLIGLIITILISIGKLGYQDLIFKIFAEESGFYNKAIGVLILRLFAAMLFVFIILVVFLLNRKLFTFILLISSSRVVFRSFDFVENFLLISESFKQVVIIRFTLMLLSVIFKLIVIYYFQSWWTMCIAIVFEAMIGALIYFFALKVNPKAGYIRTEGLNLRSLFLRGVPLLFSSIAVILYMKLDQVVISYYLGNESLGIYSVAVRLIDFLLVIPVVLTNLNSSLLFIKEHAFARDKFVVRYLLMGLLLSLGIYFCSGELVGTILGEEFEKSQMILRVMSLTVPFVFIGVLNSKLLINQGMLKDLRNRSYVGLFSNVILSIALLHWFGLVGVAVATLLTQIIVTVLWDIFNTHTRFLHLYRLDLFKAFLRQIGNGG